MGPCKFNISWLSEKDCNNVVISSWAKEYDAQHIFCKVCEKKIPIVGGVSAIKQHSQGKKHKTFLKNKFGGGQLQLQVVGRAATTGNQVLLSKSLSLALPKENSVKTELIWALKTVSNNYSFKSSEGIKEVFREMFPDTKVLEHFTLSPKKLSYLITEALGPYFKKQSDIGNEYFSLLYDETTNKAGQKELQFQIRYWSESTERIVTQHLQTFFIQHATAEILLNKLNECLDSAKLSQNRLLMIGSDGPNVNQKVYRLLTEQLKLVRGKGLIDVGTYTIHLIHNAFLKGMQKCGNEISDLLVALKYFFKDNPARWVDFEIIQNKLKIKNHRFIKHVATRWLAIGPAASRLIEQWPAVEEYFFKFVPAKCSYIEKTSRYKSIIKALRNPLTKATLLFVISSSEVFTRYTEMFQKNQPLVHLIYTEINLLLTTIISRFCKPEKCNNLLTSNFQSVDETFKDENLIPAEEMTFIPELSQELSKLKPVDKTRLMYDIRNHYVAACKYILKNIPILQDSSVIKHLRCLAPSNIKSKKSVKDISELVSKLPFEIQQDQVIDEWRLLQLEIEAGSLKPNTKERVDVFWSKIFVKERVVGEPKYATLALVIKPLLSLSHGNADVERVFSDTGRLIIKDRASMGGRMVDSVLSVTTVLKNKLENKVELVPITKELLGLARTAHSSYQAYLDKKKAEAELEEQRKLQREEAKKQEEGLRQLQKLEKEKIEELELKVKNLAEKESNKKQAGNKLLSEANIKLTQGLKRNDLVQVDIAKNLLVAAQNLRNEEAKYGKMKCAILKQVNKRKSDLLEGL